MSKAKPIPIPKETLIDLYNNQGLPCSKISQALGYKSSQIYYFLTRYEIPRRGANSYPIWNKGKKGQKSWNKGLTKETDSRVAKQAENRFKDKNPYWKGGIFKHKPEENGYIGIKLYPGNPFYPMAQKDGYCQEHRLVIAKFLSRCLTSNELIHHKNGKRYDNRLENLELVTRKDHKVGYEKGFEEGYKAGYQKGVIDGQQSIK